MKKIIIILSTSFVFDVSLTAQTAGDYRSKESGNWNDATRWDTYNGSNWVSSATYPGQNPGTGTVTIMNETEIILTATVPHPVSALDVTAGAYCNCSDDNYNQTAPRGSLTFSSVTAISLTILGGVRIDGEFLMADQSGAKTHTILIGGSLVVGNEWYNAVSIYDEFAGYYYWEYYYYKTPTVFQTINQDDKLSVTFNTTNANSIIAGLSSIRIPFQDITFNGIGIGLVTGIEINGTASFINGIVRSHNLCSGGYACDASPSSYCPPLVSNCGSIFFKDGAMVAGASVNSFVDGRVWKEGDDSFTFPVGDEGVFSPLTISAPPGPQEIFSARYTRSEGDPALWGITDEGLFSISNCEYWELNYGDNFYFYNSNSPTSFSIAVTVGWNASSGCGPLPYISDVAGVTLAHFNAKSWDAHGGVVAGTASNGTVTWNDVKNFGPFTLGNLNTYCNAPNGLNTTNITTNSAKLNWSAVPGSLGYDVSYRPTTTNQWTHAATSIASTSLPIAGLNPLVVYEWRVKANCGSTSSAYKLLQFMTQNPCSTPTGLSAGQITSTSALLTWAPVPNAANYTLQYKVSTESTWPTSNAIYTVAPSVSLSGLVASTTYDWRVIAVCYTDPWTGYGSYEGTGSFTTAAITVCNDNYEPNNSSGVAKTIKLSMSISAAISSETDVDWFKVDKPNNPNSNLRITLSNLPADYDLYVYDKNLMLVGTSTNSGNLTEVVIHNSLLRKTTYYIKVVAKNGVYNSFQCYNLLAEAVAQTNLVASYDSEPANETANVSTNELIYPNPASEFVYLRFSTAMEGPVKVQIFNAAGQLIKQSAIKITQGYNQAQIAVNDIVPGLYVLRINKGELNLTKKFVIAR